MKNMGDKPIPSLQDFIPFAFGLSPSPVSTPPTSGGFTDQYSQSPYSEYFRSPINNPNNPRNKFTSPKNHLNSFVNHNSSAGYRNSLPFRRSHSNYYNLSSPGFNYSNSSPNTSSSWRSSSFSSFNNSSFDMQENNGDYSKYLHSSFIEDPWEQLKGQRELKKMDK